MIQNILRGIQINYHYLMVHREDLGFLLFIVLFFALFILTIKIRREQKLMHFAAIKLQEQMEDIHFRLDRLHRLFYEGRDKQRLISTQLSKIDDSVFELEERVTLLKNSLKPKEPYTPSEFMVEQME